MTSLPEVVTRRRAMLGRLFPGGIPRLWCPLLTHYRIDGSFDLVRIEAQLRSLAPHLGGLLAPGSTGDGWEMPPAEQRRLLREVLKLARTLGLPVLVGVLRTETAEVLASLGELAAELGVTAAGDPLAALTSQGVCGFTICPPRGAELSQDEIESSLAAALELNLPVALYQLPQVTENEISAETAARLAAQYANFFLLKDTSGADRIAQGNAELGGVFLVRGAEGDYLRWLRAGGGPYDGLLLSTANCFARQYRRLIAAADSGDLKQAAKLIHPVEDVVAAAFEAVAAEPHGNPFTNANKAIDHFLAHGAAATAAEPPRLYSGGTLSGATLDAVRAALDRAGLCPPQGYLAPHA